MTGFAPGVTSTCDGATSTPATVNARVAVVRWVLLVLRAQREDLIRLRDRLIELGVGDGRADSDPRAGGRAGEPNAAKERPTVRPAVAPDEEARLIRLR